MLKLSKQIMDWIDTLPTKEVEKIAGGTYTAPDVGAMFMKAMKRAEQTPVGQANAKIRDAVTSVVGQPAMDVYNKVGRGVGEAGKFVGGVAAYIPATIAQSGANYIQEAAQPQPENLKQAVIKEVRKSLAALPAGVAIVGGGLAGQMGNKLMSGKTGTLIGHKLMKILEKQGVNPAQAAQIGLNIAKNIEQSTPIGRIAGGALKGGLMGGMIGGTGEGTTAALENQPIIEAAKRTLGGIAQGGISGALLGGAFAGAGEVGRGIKTRAELKQQVSKQTQSYEKTLGYKPKDAYEYANMDAIQKLVDKGYSIKDAKQLVKKSTGYDYDKPYTSVRKNAPAGQAGAVNLNAPVGGKKPMVKGRQSGSAKLFGSIPNAQRSELTKTEAMDIYKSVLEDGTKTARDYYGDYTVAKAMEKLGEVSSWEDAMPKLKGTHKGSVALNKPIEPAKEYHGGYEATVQNRDAKDAFYQISNNGYEGFKGNRAGRTSVMLDRMIGKIAETQPTIAKKLQEARMSTRTIENPAWDEVFDKYYDKIQKAIGAKGLDEVGVWAQIQAMKKMQGSKAGSAGTVQPELQKAVLDTLAMATGPLVAAKAGKYIGEKTSDLKELLARKFANK